MSKVLWISWERQRRTVELAKALQCKLDIIEHLGLFRYPKLIVQTVKIVKKDKPSILIVQNPSMVLAFLSVVFLKPIFSLPIIVDRHSNFLLTHGKRNVLFELLFNFLSFVTIRYAELTIVTNAELAHVVKVLGGNPLVLPDKIPKLRPQKMDSFSREKKILVISTFAADEPIKEIMQAFGRDDMSSYSVYISGNSLKSNIDFDKIASNIILTGFLPDNEYVDLLFQVDVVIVLSKQDYTLLCGCYEAISAEKPLITSNSTVLRHFFSGAVFVENNSDSITDGVIIVFDDIDLYKSRSLDMKRSISKEWDVHFGHLKSFMNRLVNN